MRYFRIACLSVTLAVLALLTIGMVHAESPRTEMGTLPWTPSFTISGPYSQTAELAPMGPGSGNYFGSAIAITAHPGSTGAYWAVVGAPDEAGGGAVYIFSLASGGSEWRQELRLANPGRPGDYFGGAVAIDTAEIGTGTIAIGAPSAASAGEVFIYTRQSDGSWKKTAEISAPTGSAGFGASVLLSGNAFLIIGAPDNNGGQVATFTHSGTTWSLQRILVPPDPLAYTRFGESLAFDGHFNLLIGRPYYNGPGSAYIFFYRPTIGTWTFRQKLVPADASGTNFGVSAAIAGTTMFLGYPTASRGGAVSVFAFDSSSGTWTEQPELLGSDVGAVYFGASAAVNEHGTNLLVASSAGTRSARLYSNSTGAWTPSVEYKPSAKNASGEVVAIADNLVLVASPNADLDLPNRGIVETFATIGSSLGSMRATTDEFPYYYASSVALSGSTALVSAPMQQNLLGDTGTANVYIRNAQNGWDWQAGLPQALDGDRVDLSCNGQVAIDGDTAVIGEPNKAVGTHPDQGVASVYVRSGVTWTLQETLYDRSGQTGDLFGCSVSIAGNTIVAGAPGMNGSAGGGYVSTRTGDTWSAPHKLVASDGLSGDYLGLSSAVGGNTVALGSSRKDSYAGAAYVFVASGSSWTQLQKLTPGAASGQVEFGAAVSFTRDGKTLVVGAPDTKVGTIRSGTAALYINSAGSWTLQQTLNANVPTDGGRFGTAVSVDGNTAVVGEPNISRAHVFVRNGSLWSEKASAEGDGEFGSAVSISKTAVIVGAIYDQHSGRAYIINDADEIFANGFD